MISYIKGQLSGIEKNMVEKHLSSCEMCSDELEGISLLTNSDKLESIASELDRRIDKSNRVGQNNIFSINLIIRIAAGIVLIIGISSVIYFVAFRNTPKLIITENTGIKPPASHSLDSSKFTKSENVSGLNRLKTQEPEKNEDERSELLNKEEVEEITNQYAIAGVTDSLVLTPNPVSEQIVASDSIADVTKPAVSGRSSDDLPVEAKATRTERSGLFSKKSKNADIAAVSGIQTAAPVIISRESQQSTAIIYFNNEVYDKAYKIFSALLIDDPGNDTLLYYTSVCQYHLNDYWKAIERLKDLSHKPKFSFYNESKWYYALALIQVGRIKSADSLLKSIVREDSPFVEKAKQELEKL